MKQPIDIATWERRDHFHFFNAFEDPFFGVVVDVDVTHAYNKAKAQGVSFFLSYLHASLAAVNEVDAFRYRIADGEVWLYDTIHASPTINRPNGTFGFAYMDFVQDRNTFIEQAQKEIDRVQQSTGLVPALSGENVIHYSSIPWIRFTALSHARSFRHRDSIPKISFGKMTEAEGKLAMPMSVHAHHALMDGYHVGQYITRFQALLDQ
jgi:chloramphenicol O-acetyltransferase type A